MISSIKAVVDTNVFIDAIFNNDQSCQSILKHKHDGDIIFCMNKEMYDELYLIFSKHLDVVKLKKDLQRLLPKFGNTLYQVEWIPRDSHTEYCEDKSDNKFIDCCIDGKIKYLITSDMHIREVQKELDDIKRKYNLDLEIMSPFQFNRELLRIKFSKK